MRRISEKRYWRRSFTARNARRAMDRRSYKTQAHQSHHTMMPEQKPGRSKQDYETPWQLIHAIEREIIHAKFAIDLAGTQENKKADIVLTHNSLSRSWHFTSWSWLNPPFAHIDPWAEKCNIESQNGAKICFLVPASIGSEWYAKHIHNHARVLALRPRISFDNKGPYPKDCILCIFGHPSRFELWKWK